MSYSKGALVTVPGTVIQGRIIERIEAKTYTTPALNTVAYLDVDGQQRETTFRDSELSAANVATARIVAVAPAKKSKRK